MYCLHTAISTPSYCGFSNPSLFLYMNGKTHSGLDRGGLFHV